MIHTTLDPSDLPLPEPTPSYPFLWKGENGCVYLRNEQREDIIIRSPRWNSFVGKVVPPSLSKPTAEVWAKRLPPNFVLRLQNAE